MDTFENQNSIFPKGDKAPAEYFTGTAWIKLLVPNDAVFNCQIGNVVFEGKTGLLSPVGDEKSFAGNLLRLIENVELRAKMAGAGRIIVEEKFSFRRLCMDMSTLYRQLLEEQEI